MRCNHFHNKPLSNCLAPLLCLLVLCLASCSARPPSVSAPVSPTGAEALAMQVEVIRTAYGVPHIYADNFRALGYALGYLQLEDYGAQVALGMLRARGELARYQGRSGLDSDFENRPAYLRTVEVYDQLGQDTRDVYEGFAEGVTRYVGLHADAFPEWMPTSFTGYDVAALYFYRPGARDIERWRRRLSGSPASEVDDQPFDPRAGSSAWALGPSRTASGAAILLRNPHLGWDAGYWEVHVVVSGRLDFYGDFRIGGPLGIIGGFNRHLGFATTNNNVNGSEVYALELDPEGEDRYRFDDAWHPVESRTLTLPYREREGYVTETRARLHTHLGPVVYRDEKTLYVLRTAEDGAFLGGEQFLRLIQARDLGEWTDAMRLRAHPVSNFVYADAAGNIFYIWNAAIPVRPHPAGGGEPVPAMRTTEIWTELHSLESLPQLLNPEGGYVRNENDGPWLTNLRQRLDPADYPDYFEGSSLSLRSQHALLLVDTDELLTLETVIERKHSYRMLLADRVKDDMVTAVETSLASSAVPAGAIALLESWDNTARADSRGAVLFETWWRLYEEALDETEPFAEAWSEERPTDTPKGLSAPELAARLFPVALAETRERWGSWDVPWGDVHRVRRGDVDEPVGGCGGELGCFRVLNFDTDSDGLRTVDGGDGWALAVEFTDPPRGYSILGYGQSRRPDSPHYADQAALFARGEMKAVAYTREDVERSAVRRYRPGLASD